MDPGYISRTLRLFEKDGLIIRQQKRRDKRSAILYLTEQGWKWLDHLVDVCNHIVDDAIGCLSDGEIQEVVLCMKRIEGILGDNKTCANSEGMRKDE